MPRINALGKTGSEKMGERVLAELGVDAEKIDVDNSNVESSERLIYSRAMEIFREDEKAVFIGGDHSITYPIFKAFRENYKDAFLIMFDAHADCMSPMKEPTHEEFLRAIIEDGFNPENVILVGARKIEPEEERFLKEKNIKVFTEINDMEAAADYITEKANGRDIYVSVDIDVLDPAFAPAVSYPEVGGMTSKELLYLLKRIFRIKSLKAMDIVEAIPSKDEKYDMRTIKICAKIISEFIQ